MQLNTYRARSIIEATAKVKNELGPEAMILSTRKLEGSVDGNRFEITAALSRKNSSGEAYTEFKSDLMSIKEMIYLMNQSGKMPETVMMNPSLLEIYARMVKNGINDRYARILLERGGALPGSASTGDAVRVATVREILNLVDIGKPFASVQNGPVVSALVGTTGVGKTTTIAKLAARLMFKSGKKVGLISIDNYRIGAVEQLKTYAAILGIPCFAAFNRKDLILAIERMKNKDVILIDTAGQSQYDAARIDELQQLMGDGLDIRSHLLLNVATSEAEMEKTAANFSPLNYRSYIFTKLDKSDVCGSIINQLMKLKLPVSFITTGQNVPEDIEAAGREKILKRVLSKTNAFEIGA